MKKVFLLLGLLLFLVACSTQIKEDVELIRECPESWWENAEPYDCETEDCLTETERSYMIINEEKYYESEVDLEWVQENCQIIKEIVE